MKLHTNDGPLELADQHVARPALLQRKVRLVRASGAIRSRCARCGQPSAGLDDDGAALCTTDFMIARQRRMRAAMRAR